MSTAESFPARGAQGETCTAVAPFHENARIIAPFMARTPGLVRPLTSSAVWTFVTFLFCERCGSVKEPLAVCAATAERHYPQMPRPLRELKLIWR
ncbi:hypothetical protein AALO_G00178660 [Alosa alosa]|uniref:Uncharacterized protein n=1 Tax=Alosa alosa TaxID=278164 RepID=A0AAV6GDB1_9TELE|nr:hypothetical protein AALO_G00178660 [Alosa alosa]